MTPGIVISVCYNGIKRCLRTRLVPKRTGSASREVPKDAQNTGVWTSSLLRHISRDSRTH